MEERVSEDPGLNKALEQLTARRALLQTQAEREAPQGAEQAPPLLLSQVAPLERLVLAENCPLDARFYAWVKLVRQWSSMRWDDTSGVISWELKRRARGMAGRLEGSKTSGRHNKVRLLPLFVSREAFLTQPWLDTGPGFL